MGRCREIKNGGKQGEFENKGMVWNEEKMITKRVVTDGCATFSRISRVTCEDLALGVASPPLYYQDYVELLEECSCFQATHWMSPFFSKELHEFVYTLCYISTLRLLIRIPSKGSNINVSTRGILRPS